MKASVVKVRDRLLFVIAEDHRISDWRVGDQICLRLGGDISANRRPGARSVAVVPGHVELITANSA